VLIVRILSLSKAVIAAALLLAGQAYSQFTIVPSTPRPYDTVRVLVGSGTIGGNTPFNGYDPSATLVTMAGNKITISLLMADIFGGTGLGMDLPVGQFPPGTYEIEVKRRAPGGFEYPSLGNTTFTIPSRTAAEPLWNHSDLWWNPQESGWGLNIMHHGLGKIFATWFVYDANRNPTWYVIPDGQWITPTEYRGSIYRTNGPGFRECEPINCSTPFDPRLVNVVLVGSAKITFNPFGSDAASAELTVDGRTYVRLIRRQSF
jgi:hypothetical protein